MQSDKVVALLDVADPRGFRDKSSIERKLLSSCLYDLAKEYLVRSPSLDHKVVFKAFWSLCVNLHPFENQFCPYKSRESTLKALSCAVFTSVVYALRPKKNNAYQVHLFPRNANL